MQAVYLIGGMGTRLGGLVKDTPKPLLPTPDRPFLQYLIDKATHHGFTQHLLLSGYKGDVVDRAFAGQKNIVIFREDEPLGTAGALHAAAAFLQDEFLLMNGDSFFDFDYGCFFRHQSDDMATLALRWVEDASRYGSATLEGHKIKAFHEKRIGDGLINGGVYKIKKTILSHIPAGPSSLERDIFPKLVEQSALGGYIFEGFFIDMGLPATYAEACKIMPTLRMQE